MSVQRNVLVVGLILVSILV